MAEYPPTPPGTPVAGGPGQGTNGLAVAGMICGILGLVLFWTIWLGIILGVLGIIFGAIGQSRAKTMGGTGRGMAMAGLICGAIAVVAAIIFVVFIASQVNDVENILEQLEEQGMAAALFG